MHDVCFSCFQTVVLPTVQHWFACMQQKICYQIYLSFFLEYLEVNSRLIHSGLCFYIVCTSKQQGLLIRCHREYIVHMQTLRTAMWWCPQIYNINEL